MQFNIQFWFVLIAFLVGLTYSQEKSNPCVILTDRSICNVLDQCFYDESLKKCTRKN